MADNNVANLTSIRGKDWIFNAIWAACGEQQAPKCIINIPLTFIFRQGQPFKALETDPSTGCVRRVNIEATDVQRVTDDQGFRGESNRLLRIFRYLLVMFQQNNEYDFAQKNDDDSNICTILYTDGEREDISLRTMDILMRNDNWRMQVLLAQGYIPSRSSIEGRYSQTPKVRSKLDTDGAEAADIFMRALAKYAEKAYTVSSKAIHDQSVIASFPGGGRYGQELDFTREVKLQVREITGTFALDPKDRIIYLYSTYTAAEIETGQREVEEYIAKERSGRELTAAQSVVRDLRALLSHADRRGLPPEESYAHFDPQGNGFINTDLLIDGLARLGIGATYPVAQSVLQLIGGLGSTFLSYMDFHRFVSVPADVVLFGAEDAAASPTRQGAAAVGASRGVPGGSGATAVAAKRAQTATEILASAPGGANEKAAAKAKKKADAQLRPPRKPGAVSPARMGPWGDGADRLFAEGSLAIEDSQVYEWDEYALEHDEDEGSAISSPSKRGARSSSKGRGASYSYTDSFGSELPAPEEAYRVQAPPQSATDLPPWATKQQRRALKTLRGKHDEWQQKQQKSDAGSVDSAAGEHPPHSPSKHPSNGPSSRQGYHPSVKPLNLTAIHKEMTYKLVKSADELLHVDKGVVMTYRVVLGAGSKEDRKTHEESEELRYRSVLEEREKNLEEMSHGRGEGEGTGAGSEAKAGAGGGFSVPGASKEAKGQGDNGKDFDRWLAFTLVVVPDLFSTLEVLQRALEPILTKYPLARIVLVGVPGMPNTSWPKGWVLNSDMHARSLVKLFQFLHAKSRLTSVPGEPIFLMGFGTGSFTLSRFVSLYLPALSWMEEQVKVVCIVNGMLKYSKHFKGICRDFRQSLLRAGIFEVNELVTSLHLSDQYLAINDREESLKKFWGPRKGICSEGTDPDRAGLGYVGVLEMLKAILINPDDFDGAAMLLTEIPLLVVQSTEDVFVTPRTAEMFQAERLPPERTLVTDFADSLDPGAVHVCWLKSGHEVIQERTPYLLGMISNLAQMCGIKPSQDGLEEQKKPVEEEEDEIFDVLALAERRRREREEAKVALKQAEDDRLAEEARARAERKAERKALKERERIEREIREEEERRMAKEKEDELALASDFERIQREADEKAVKEKEDEEEAERRRVRQAAEKERRMRLMDERKRREAKAQRKMELEVLYERERVEKERKSEARELVKMQKEELMSRLGWEYQKQQEMIAESMRLAKVKADDLAAVRKAEAVRRVEEQLARERSARIEERRRKADEIVKQIESEELLLSGAADGGYEAPPTAIVDVAAEIAAAQRLMRDLLECRQKSVESLKRQMLIQGKMETFRKQCESADLDVRRMRQAIRLVKINPSLIGNAQSTGTEIEDMRRSLALKEESYQQISAVTKSREKQLSAANRSVQLLKITSRELDKLMMDKIRDLHSFESKFVKKISEIKMEKEHLVAEKDKLRVQKIMVEKRIADVDREMHRIQNHKGKLVDTDVWVEGVLQRMHTKELRQFLRSERGKAGAQLEKIVERLAEDRLEILNCTDRLGQTKRNCDRISMAARTFLETYQKFSAVPVSQIMKNMTEQQDSAEAIEKRRVGSRNHEAIDGAQTPTTEIEKVRVKDPEIRTKDERRFIGIDLIMNPEAYVSISLVEAEQMQFDEDYQCDLPVSDLQRIYKLPPQVNLALPFLHTPQEVEIHRIVNQFTRNHTDDSYREKDYYCDGNPADESTNPTTSSMSSVADDTRKKAIVAGVETHHMSEAETVHDILLRECRRDRIRARGEGEEMEQEEREWIVLDKIMSPHVYDIVELELPDDIGQRNVLKDLSSSVIDLKPMDRVTKMATEEETEQELARKPPRNMHRDGDIFDEMRAREDNGEVVFDFSWRCPYSRDQVLAIRRKTVIDHKNADELKVRFLLDKYYVSEDESVLGAERLLILHKVTRRLTKVQLEQEETERREKEILERFRANIGSVDIDELANELAFRPKGKGAAAGKKRSLADTMKAAAVATGGFEVVTVATEDISVSAGVSSSAFVVSQLSEVVEAGEGEGEGDDLDDDDDDDEDEDVRRIWGSWEQVHPASAGVNSQSNLFMVSAYNASRDHPAAYAIHDPDSRPTAAAIATKPNLPTGSALHELGMKILTSMPGKTPSINSGAGESKFDAHHNDPNSKWFIAESLTELAMIDSRRLKKKTPILAVKEPTTLLEINNATLQARQSRSHRFEIADKESMRVLDLTITIVYQGNFGTKGYKMGRLAASLFRLPDEKDPNSSPLPLPVGYCPYHLQSPNLPELLGRVVIIHRPRQRPIKPCIFQLVVGCASNTKYSIQVSARYAQTALPLVDKFIEEARIHQSRLPICLKELDGLSESVRMAERKLVVCKRMIEEAESESIRCQRGLRAVAERLEEDNEEMTLFEDERKDLERELAILEVEYAQWATVYASRARESDDIREGINLMYEFQRQRQKEKNQLKEDLARARHDLPACVAVLRNFQEAANVAASLNTVVQTANSSWGSATTGDIGLPTVSTPAEDIRRRMKREGFKALTLEEQQWCLLDQALSADKYEWLRERDEEENAQRLALGKRPKVVRYNAAVEAYRIPKIEIERIMETPFSMLSRREMLVRKLLVRFHDDAELMKKTFAAAAYGFDPHLAERTRAKDPRAYRKEEKEWASIDRILHPEVWKFYSNFSEEDAWKDKSGASAVVGAAGPPKKKGGVKAAEQSDLAEGQQKVLAAMGKMLGLENEVMNEATNLTTSKLDINDVLHSMHKKAVTAVDPSLRAWDCPWSKEEIFRVWRSARHSLKSDEERHAFQLLQKYNGSYSAYMEAIEQANKRKGHGAVAGSHIQWEMFGKVVNPDIDMQCRLLQREIDKAANNRSEWMDSEVLHGQKQRFPTKVMRQHLEEAMDALMMEQIKERERNERRMVDSSDSEDEDDEDEALEVDGKEGDEEGDVSLLAKVKRRAKRREKRRQKHKQVSEEDEVLKARKMVNTKNKSGQALAEAILQNQLGVGGCVACRTNPCSWTPSVDEAVCQARKKVLDQELERVKLDKESRVIESDVCLSAQLGGNRLYHRMDLLDELTLELTQIDRHLELNNIDKELHDSYATRKEFFEVKYLHGYSMMLWTNNARVALNARHRKLIAFTVAKEVVDDILDWMLEGWYFGERVSENVAMGHVPSIKPEGMMHAGQDQIRAMGVTLHKAQKRKEARKKGIVLDEARKGTGHEKAQGIEAESQFRITELKVARDGNRHEHMLNETESTLRFGLFMLTIMYFRAMVFLRREQRSWGGEDDEIGNTSSGGKAMTDERMRMLDEENKAAARKKKVDVVLAKARVGEQRRKEREASERKEAIRKLQAIVRRQQQEVDSVCFIQKVFRGHLGRKAAHRWALKRAELGAMNALLNAAATFLQRVYRGYRARVLTVQKRMEMAQFIALMRAQEAQADEELYWETHPWSRFKKDQKDWYDKKFRKAHQINALGGARLTEDEEAEVLGKDLDDMPEDTFDDEEADDGEDDGDEDDGDDSADDNIDDDGANEEDDEND